MTSSPALARLLSPGPNPSPSSPNTSTPSTSTHPIASFNTLPPELKAHIVLLIAQQEQLDALQAEEDALEEGEDDPFVHEMITSEDDSEVEEVDGDEADEGVIAESGWTDPPSVDSLWNVAKVSRELAGLAWEHLWRRVDFTGRSTEDVLTFYHEILPRHSRHIHALRFDQLHHLDELIPSPRIAELLPTLVSPSSPLSPAELSALATIAERQPWRLRSYVFAAVVAALPRLDALVFDLAPFIGRSAEAEEVAGLVNEREANPLLRAVEAKGERIRDLTVATPIVALDGRQLGAFLRALPNLQRLEMETTLRPNGGGEAELIAALASLTQLETLSLASAPWVNATFARAAWSAPLRVLALNSCDQLWVEDLRTLVEKFSATLDTLDLDDSPAGELFDDGEPRRPLDARQAAQGKDWGRPWRLPRLNYFVLANDQDAHFLDFFADCPVHTFEFGYCPLIQLPAIEAFLKRRAGAEAGPGRLREVRIKGDADLTDGQRESIEVWCYSKGVVCKSEVGGGWTSDYSDDEMERDEVEEWSDVDDDERGYDQDLDMYTGRGQGGDEDGEGWESDEEDEDAEE